MQVIQFLKQSMSSTFPFLTKAHLASLPNPWKKEIQILSRLSKFAADKVSLKERKQLTDLKMRSALYKHITEQASDTPTHIYSLLLENENTDPLISVYFWAECIEDALVNEEDPLNNLRSEFVLFERPTQFAGLIWCLLRKKIDPEAIRNSGILNEFFAINCYDMSKVVETYDLLESLKKHDEEIAKFLALVNETACFKKDDFAQHRISFHDFAVTGRCSQSELHVVSVSPETASYAALLKGCNTTLTNFYAIFGQVFLIRVIDSFLISENAELETFLKPTINMMSIKELENLFSSVNTLAEAKRKEVFVYLATSLDKEAIRGLLKGSFACGWYWFIIRSC